MRFSLCFDSVVLCKQIDIGIGLCQNSRKPYKIFCVTLQAQGATHLPVTDFVLLITVASASHLDRYLFE